MLALFATLTLATATVDDLKGVLSDNQQGMQKKSLHLPRIHCEIRSFAEICKNKNEKNRIDENRIFRAA